MEQQNPYTLEEQEDIKAREAKAVAMLKELQLVPEAVIQAANAGNDVFGLKVVPFLRDVKYNKSLKKEEESPVVMDGIESNDPTVNPVA